MNSAINNLKSSIASLLLVSFIALIPQRSEAATYQYDSVVTLCTATCGSFASLALGSTITGTMQIQVAAGGSFDDSDVVTFSYEVFNPALPVSGPVGDTATDNPMLINLSSATSNGTAGTTGIDLEIDSGEIALEFTVAPLNDNGAFAIFDPVTGISLVCLFYIAAGCVPGATEVVIYEGVFSLVIPNEIFFTDGFESP